MKIIFKVCQMRRILTDSYGGYIKLCLILQYFPTFYYLSSFYIYNPNN